MADTAKQAGDDGETTRGDGGIKFLAYVLIALNLVVFGGWFYISKVFAAGLETKANGITKDLATTKAKIHAVCDTAERINLDRITEVTDLKELVTAALRDIPKQGGGTVYDDMSVNKAAAPANVQGAIETTVRVQVNNKTGYPFKDFMTVLGRIEDSNPSVQIREVDFGKRELSRPEDMPDTYRPTSFVVRVLSKKSKSTP